MARYRVGCTVHVLTKIYSILGCHDAQMNSLIITVCPALLVGCEVVIQIFPFNFSTIKNKNMRCKYIVCLNLKYGAGLVIRHWMRCMTARRKQPLFLCLGMEVFIKVVHMIKDRRLSLAGYVKPHLSPPQRKKVYSLYVT